MQQAAMELFTWICTWHVVVFIHLHVWVRSQAIDATPARRTDCEAGTFGRKCRLQCHCADDSDCGPTRGRCAKGCAVPWKGDTCQKQNVALTKPTFQSSTLRSLGTVYTSRRAVDGQSAWPYCSHSVKELNPYWTVDLVLPTTIYHARILNRNDCCQDRLKGFKVFVSTTRDLSSATLCYSSPGWETPGVIIDFHCTTPVIGRYVSILIPRLDFITLCDVELYECADHTFGRDCLGECHCLNEGEVCDKRTGLCKSGCGAGWTGDTCQTACPDFRFGVNCESHCQCQQFNEVCDKVTGACQSGCLPGLGGVGCQSECQNYTYGSDCAGRCQCLDTKEVCDRISGRCSSGCSPGWTGVDCGIACTAGSYGLLCRGQCQCADPADVCDHISGFCLSGCAPGWVGNRCHIECPDGQFGERCAGRCNCYDAGEVCAKDTGRCSSGCAGDSLGDGCTECPIGRYGSGCEEECRCRNATEQCDRLTGYCLSGCSNNPGANICFQALTSAPRGLPAEAVGGIIGGIVAVLLVIMLVVLLCVSRRRKSKKGQRSHNIMYENCGPEFVESATSLPIVNTSFDQQLSDETQGVVYQNCRDVDVNQNAMDEDELFDYVQAFLTDRPAMEKSFNEIPVPLTPTVEANKPENLRKNRYKHILPFDRTRVILHDVTDGSTDYINASYVDGYQKPRAFIATQGPTPGTVVDFWRMVWQENCGKVVMLTNLQEAGRRKCEQYWPTESAMEWGPFTVHHLATEDFAHFSVHSLKLSKGSDVKTVNQFHFRSWSDHDAPDDTTGILHLRDKIRDTNVETDGPTVVHCSAGVGRTGTYIALDILIESAQKEGVVAIDDCIHKLRGQRMHMIQNSTQYEFLHRALRDAILCHNSSTSAGRFLEDSLTDSSTAQQRIAAEFLALGKFKALENRKKELATEKKSKNRAEDIIACDAHRVFLSTNIPDTTNYINAIFVPSYYSRHGLIVTQTPLTETVIDFWRLVYEQRCTCIVLLQQDPNEDQKSYFPLNGEDLTVGPFVVSVDEESPNKSMVKTRTLSLHYDKEFGEGVMKIKQFCFSDWRSGDVTPTSPRSIISLLELVDDWHRESGTGQTLVHCLNGAFRSGIYAAANMILERLKSEHVVNVMQTVHQLRVIRPQFIYTPEQYQFCYDVAKAYLQNFQGYQNFN